LLLTWEWLRKPSSTYWKSWICWPASAGHCWRALVHTDEGYHLSWEDGWFFSENLPSLANWYRPWEELNQRRQLPSRRVWTMWNHPKGMSKSVPVSSKHIHFMGIIWRVTSTGNLSEKFRMWKTYKLLLKTAPNYLIWMGCQWILQNANVGNGW
jgi:hypothetical protein